MTMTMTRPTIRGELGADWGVEEIRDSERDAYAAHVLAALSADYPDHEIEISHGALVESVYAESSGEDCNCDGEDCVCDDGPVESRALELEVEARIQDVWNEGTFWDASELDLRSEVVERLDRDGAMTYTIEQHTAQGWTRDGIGESEGWPDLSSAIDAMRGLA